VVNSTELAISSVPLFQKNLFFGQTVEGGEAGRGRKRPSCLPAAKAVLMFVGTALSYGLSLR